MLENTNAEVTWNAVVFAGLQATVHRSTPQVLLRFVALLLQPCMHADFLASSMQAMQNSRRRANMDKWSQYIQPQWHPYFICVVIRLVAFVNLLRAGVTVQQEAALPTLSSVLS